jgi:HEAT repeat protein
MRELALMLEPDAASAAQPRDAEHWLMPLLRDEDPWLRACAIYASGPDRWPELRPLLEAARADPNRIVSETAVLVLREPSANSGVPC